MAREGIIIGNSYGNIKVLSLKENKGNGKIFYNCILTDTNEEIVLRSDYIKKYKGKIYTTKKDGIEIGSSYNNIKVLKLDHNDHGRKFFVCTCNECIKDKKCTYVLRSDIIKDPTRKNKYRCKIEKPRKDIEDLTGNIYGDLIVISLDKIESGKGSFWNCKCKCGNIISVSRSNLVQGNTTRCRDCANKIVAMKNTKDLTGKRFGKLVVKSMYRDKENDTTYCDCICDCGNTRTVRSHALINESITACEECTKIERAEKDFIGKPFGRLTVIKFDHFGSDGSVFECECSCDNHTHILVSKHSLTSGNTQSCGCLTIENNKARAKHSMYNTSFYRIWIGMKSRCYNPNDEFYYRYGGRGIKVCDRWLGDDGFINFYNDMYPTYQEGLSIDRIDNDGDYCPENCRWITMTAQQNNKSTNRYVYLYGRYWTLAQAAEKFSPPGITSSKIAERLNNMWSDSDAVFIPLGYTPSTYKPITKPIRFFDDLDNPGNDLRPNNLPTGYQYSNIYPGNPYVK